MASFCARVAVALAALLVMTNSERTVLFIKVFKNGEDTNGVNVRMTEALFASHPSFPYLMNEALEPEQRVERPRRVMTELGSLVTRFDDLLDVDRIYVVAEGFHFHWPAIKIGHRIDFNVEGLDAKIGIETLSMSPKVFRIHNFVSLQEADTLVDQNRDGLKRSATGMDFRTNDTVPNSVRTSQNAFDITTPLAMKIKRRSFDMMRMDYADNQADGLQVLNYKPGQAYIAHVDQFDIGMDPSGKHNFDPTDGGTNRMATVFLYLNNVDEGGETVFPLSRAHMRLKETDKDGGGPKATDPSTLFDKDSWEYDLVDACRTRMAVPAIKGSAILFYTQHGNGVLDPKSIHGGCPVLQGEKWAANMWVWNGPRYGIVPGTELNVTFRNANRFTVVVYWKSDEGEQMEMFTLGPYEMNEITTHVGHIFEARGTDGIVDEFVVLRGQEEYNVARDEPAHSEL